MENIFFNDFNSLIKIIIGAPVMYALIIFYVRLFGKRTTSQMNSFDWIVTVAIGSIGATTVLSKNTPILSGAIAILTLMFSQFVITKLMLYSRQARKIIRSTPKLLLFEGEFLEKNMKEERIVKSEVYAAVRENGLPNIKDVYAVVLETDAKFSVIRKENNSTSFSLAGVQGLPDGLKDDLQKMGVSAE